MTRLENTLHSNLNLLLACGQTGKNSAEDVPPEEISVSQCLTWANHANSTLSDYNYDVSSKINLPHGLSLGLLFDDVDDAGQLSLLFPVLPATGAAHSTSYTDTHIYNLTSDLSDADVAALANSNSFSSLGEYDPANPCNYSELIHHPVTPEYMPHEQLIHKILAQTFV